MDLPVAAYGQTVAEGKMYFFKSDCPIGVKDHIHVCIKRNNRIFLFAACSSQIEKAIRRARLRNLDINTYPIFTATDVNKLKKPQTYVDCNIPIETTLEEFSQLISSGKVYEMEGSFDEASLSLIYSGIRISAIVEERIKNLL